MVNWDKAIDRNREALLRILEVLFAIVGLDGNPVVATLPRHLHNHVLRILRPAESAARRLIVIAARGIEAPTLPLRGGESDFDGLAPRSGAKRRKSQERGPFALPLIDPRKRFDFRPRRRCAKSFPRITCIGLSEPTPVPDTFIPSPDDEIDASRLRRRLQALKAALDDLDGQAKRLARWKARRDAGLLRVERFSPMRPGWPPGHRRRPLHEIDDVLRECHSLAHYALEAPDTG
jgi:hypothetical protein